MFLNAINELRAKNALLKPNYIFTYPDFLPYPTFRFSFSKGSYWFEKTKTAFSTFLVFNFWGDDGFLVTPHRLLKVNSWTVINIRWFHTLQKFSAENQKSAIYDKIVILFFAVEFFWTKFSKWVAERCYITRCRYLNTKIGAKKIYSLLAEHQQWALAL